MISKIDKDQPQQGRLSITINNKRHKAQIGAACYLIEINNTEIKPRASSSLIGKILGKNLEYT